MNKRNLLIVLMLLLLFPSTALGKEKEKPKNEYDIPNHVLDISKENTFPNSSEDQEVVEPSELTQELIDDLDVPIENPDLIKMLNETSLKPSPLAIGYRGTIYIGRWPLNYKSEKTTTNWEYQKININEMNNIGGEKDQKMHYKQKQQKEIKGALTNKITNPDDVKKMMLLKAKAKTKLPLSYNAIVGKGTKKENSYQVPAKKYGHLQAYAPAVNEKGHVTFGEVYFRLKGSDKAIVIKNVTKQGIGAWIPIQDYVSFSYQLR